MKTTELPVVTEHMHYIVERMEAIVGKEFVDCDEAELSSFGNDTSIVSQRPLAIVYPSNVTEITQLVRLANDLNIRLWPVSTGKNWGYGAACPAGDNFVIVVLERLNRIISVDEKLAYAVIEPGVTYAQLNSYLKEHGLKLWCDTTDGPPGGSVIGNALERGIGETPYGDHFGNLCGLEVVLPDGRLIQTGAGRFQNLKTWNTYKWGVGPYIEGIFSQSNFGIVTKAGIWLMPEPEVFCSFTFELSDENKFPELIETIRRLALQQVLQTKLHIINDIVGLSLLTQYSQEGLDSSNPISGEMLLNLRHKFALASWSFAAGLYGTSARINADKSLLQKELSPLGKVTFITDANARTLERLLELPQRFKKDSLGHRICNTFLKFLLGKPPGTAGAIPHIHSILKGIPTEYFVRHAYFKSKVSKPDSNVDPVRDRCGLIWFAPIAPLTATCVQEVLDICRPLFEKYGFDFYVALLLTSPRSIVVLFSIFFDKDNNEQSGWAKDLYFDLGRATEARGYQQYRTNVAYMDKILDQSHEYKKILGTIKRALDPNNILAPGRYGIDSAPAPFLENI